MTIEEAKTELQSIRALASRILERKRRLSSLRQSVQGIRIARYGESIGSTDKDRVERSLDKLREFEEQLLADIPKLEATKAEIMAKIDVLPYPQCEIMSRYFVSGQPVVVIAQSMHYSRRYVYKIIDGGIERYSQIGHKMAQNP